MFSWIQVLQIVLLLVGVGCTGDEFRLKDLTCDDFERGSYFDPYQTLDAMWKIFYFWGNTTEVYPIMFNIADKKLVQSFRTAVDSYGPEWTEAFPWRHAALVMDPRPGIQVLMFYTGSVGAFRALVKLEQLNGVHPRNAPMIRLTEIRLKMLDRLIGLMACEEETGYALVRLNEIPKTEEACKNAAAVLGFPKEGGRSYLYLEKLLQRENDEL